MNTLSYSVRTFFEEIVRLNKDYEIEFSAYRKRPYSGNPALYRARAKFIELCVLLGVAAEHLLKAVLLKHGFVINSELHSQIQRFTPQFLNTIQKADASNNPMLQAEFHKKAEKQFPPQSGKTIKFETCIDIFNKPVANQSPYFSGIPRASYPISNPETARFYGKFIDTSNALNKIRDLRNNYAHLPEPMYEDRGLIPYFYNLLLFIASKEFPEVMAGLNYI